MGHVTTFEAALPFARRAARARAKAAIRSGAWAASDYDDLQQEALAAVLHALDKFDSTRASLRTFIELVIASRFASLNRARRRRPKLVQLGENDDLVDSGFGVEVELRADIQRGLDSLPKCDRRIAVSLMTHSPTEVSSISHISRSAVYRAMGRIRAAFIAAGLQPEGSPARIAA